MDNVRVLTWPRGRHDFRGGNTSCLICGALKDEVVANVGEVPRCVPRVSRAPEGYLSTRESCVRLGLNKDAFLTRYQVRRIPPRFVHITIGTYYWDEYRLELLALGEEDCQKKLQSDAFEVLRTKDDGS